MPQLVAGYTNPPYFYTGPDGAMVFWCPAVGATTSGSTHPRTELRELLVTNDTSVNWNAEGSHTLSAQCQVSAVAGGGKVCIGQVHGYNTNIPLVMVCFDNSLNLGTVTATVKYHADGSQVNGHQDKTLTFANVAFNNPINYVILVTNGVSVVTVNGSTQSQDFYAADPDWTNVNYYFKAGNYYTDNNSTTNAAQVSFYALTMSHAPLITSQPAGLSILVGSNATYSVAASGNEPITYQWRFNVTNALARATNASLTITNAQGTNAGSYTVVVKDSWGSVTSTAAPLTVNFPPTITNQPVSLAVTNGTSATFSVGANGTPSLGYAWRFNATNLLAGATNTTLTITNAQSTNAGTYTVVVTNAYGAVTSTVATLTVNPAAGPPAKLGIVMQPTATLTAGTAANLATQPVVEVQDQSGVPVPGATNNITVTVFSGVGTLSGTTTMTPNGANGRATFTNLNLSSIQAGTVVLSFSASGVIPTNSQGLAVNPAPAVQVIFSTQPGGATNGQLLAIQPLIRTADRFGNSSTVGLPGSLPVFLTNSTGILTGLLTNDLGTNSLNGVWACTNLRFSGSLGTPHVLDAVVDQWSFGKAVLKHRWSFNGNLGEPYSGSNAVFVGGGGNVRERQRARVSGWCFDLRGSRAAADFGPVERHSAGVCGANQQHNQPQQPDAG